MMSAPPKGTRFTLPAEAARRAQLTSRLQALFSSWGYEEVDTPVLEPYTPEHPRAAQSFKLSDCNSEVLALRSDFTPALAHLVRAHYSPEEVLRLQYSGKAWQALHPDVARAREFTQLGLELVGVSNARADAELIHLAREAVREVGLVPRVELGNPGLVRALFALAEIPETAQGALASAIDRKDSELKTLLEPYALAPDLHAALLGVADLYGDVGVLAQAKRQNPWPETLRELETVEAVLAEFETVDELLLDFGRARRLSYYTGVTFQAYTFDFGQPLLGGGRYDGALLPYAAGFSLGLERLLWALPEDDVYTPPLVLSLDDAGARRLRAAGYRVERALVSSAAEARSQARARGTAYLLSAEGLEPLTPEQPHHDDLTRILEADRVTAE